MDDNFNKILLNPCVCAIFVVPLHPQMIINLNYMKKISFFVALVAMMLLPLRMVGQNRLTMSFVDANGRTVRQVEATMGEEFVEPTLMIQPAGAQVRVVYSSANERVATVDMMSGEVTLVSAGNTTIIAQSGETEEYFGAQAQYSLIVNAAQDTTPVIEPTCPEARFYMNGAQLTSLSLKVGESVSVPMLMSATGSMLSGRVSVQNTAVAIVSADNMIHGLAEGTTTAAAGGRSRCASKAESGVELERYYHLCGVRRALRGSCPVESAQRTDEQD